MPCRLTGGGLGLTTPSYEYPGYEQPRRPGSQDHERTPVGRRGSRSRCAARCPLLLRAAMEEGREGLRQQWRRDRPTRRRIAEDHEEQPRRHNRPCAQEHRHQRRERCRREDVTARMPHSSGYNAGRCSRGPSTNGNTVEASTARPITPTRSSACSRARPRRNRPSPGSRAGA